VTVSAFREDIARHAFAMPVVRWFGIELEQLRDGLCVARLPWREELSHAPGVFQANPIAALADFTGVLAGLSLLPPGSTAATMDYTVKFLAEARGDELVASGVVVSAGRTSGVSKVDVHVLHADGERLCSTALVAMRIRRP
jgi:uncharacterized protein (TIGR00369 family)